METQKLNLFIVDDNRSMVVALKQYLQSRFGLDLNISTFYDGESCLEKIDKNTHIVILDHFLNGKNGLEVLKEIKEINPKTEVIMLTSNEDISLAIQSFRSGAIDYVIKGPSSWKKITKLVYHVITEPIRIIVREFGVSKFMAIFLLTFLLMGVVVMVVLHSIS
ncbi:MAG: response regulator [Bacteroidetes bacterium]|nr:response regulator [Bacteroidota bacterium]